MEQQSKTMTEPSPPLVQVNDVLAGKYRVERVLGQGGMGVVVAAMHIDLHERRAIKFMLPSALGDVEGVERFMREARACARLKSKHVAAVYDVGRLENGAPYIVMEYLEGTDLRMILREQKTFPVSDAVDCVLQALEAIGEAHKAGIIHRDLKPANMFLASGVGGVPCVKILDFGIAKLAPSQDFASEHHEVTTTATIIGSPLYMSPEQMRSSRYVDARSDIWSIGVILYRMVTGEMPFFGQATPEIFASVLTAPPPLPSTLNPAIPKEFEAIILKCLEKEPEQRWNSAAELASALYPYATERTADSISVLTDRPSNRFGPPPSSMSGAYGSASGVGSSSGRTRTGAPLSVGISAQAQTPRGPQSRTLPSSTGGDAGSTPNQHSQTGSNSAISTRNTPPGAGCETGPTGQTSDSWSQTGAETRPPAGLSRGVALAAGLGGGLFFVGVIVVLFMMRGPNTNHGKVPPLQPSTSPEQVAEPTPSKPAPSTPVQETEVTPAPTVAPAVTVAPSTTVAPAPQVPEATPDTTATTAKPQLTQAAPPKPTSKPPTPPTQPTKPTIKKPAEPNPFD